jgi:hypothetical protein
MKFLKERVRDPDRTYDPYRLRGCVYWETIDDETGEVTGRGKGQLEKWWAKYVPSFLSNYLLLADENVVVDEARNRLAQFTIGTSIAAPQYIAIGTGTADAATSDTALGTLVQYNGSNNAKLAASRSLKGLFTARIVVQFLPAEANANIRELGLFDATDTPQNLWARVRVTINKVSTERLNVYWYIIFERRASVAIKTGSSIAATGTVTGQADSTLTFASNVTIVVLENNTGAVLYVNLNKAFDVATPPATYDFRMATGTRIFLNNEEVDISTVHVYKDSAGNFTLPGNGLSLVGW